MNTRIGTGDFKLPHKPDPPSIWIARIETGIAAISSGRNAAAVLAVDRVASPRTAYRETTSMAVNW